MPVLVADPAGPAPTLPAAVPARHLSGRGHLRHLRPAPTGAPHRRLLDRVLRAVRRADRASARTTGSCSPVRCTRRCICSPPCTRWRGRRTDRRPAGARPRSHAVPAVLADLLGTLPTTAPLRTAVVAGSALPRTIARPRTSRAASPSPSTTAPPNCPSSPPGGYPDPLRPFPGAEVDRAPRAGADAVGPLAVPGASGIRPGSTGRSAATTDGFATVGDLADRDGDGGLRIRGRGDAAITTGGATVIAEDIEAALAGLPGVAAVAVVGVPHRRLGEVVTAVIEPATRRRSDGVCGRGPRGCCAASRCPAAGWSPIGCPAPPAARSPGDLVGGPRPLQARRRAPGRDRRQLRPLP